jgi:hypothetical protein
MDEKWVKPTVEEFPVNGECTAYSGADSNRMTIGEKSAAAGVSSSGPVVASLQPECHA